MIEVFFDCSSPWSYLGFEQVQPIAAEFGEDILWRPLLVGGIFNEVNSSVYHVRENVPAKLAYNAKDLADWCRITNKIIHFPPPVFPINSAHAMRMTLLLKGEQLIAFARSVYEAYWQDGRDISDLDVLVPLADAVGVDGVSLADRAGGEDARAALKANTREAVDRGAFGVPTFFLDGTDMYFGVDRMPNVRWALERKHRALEPP